LKAVCLWLATTSTSTVLGHVARIRDEGVMIM
jgi:hypothetical protein